MKSSQQKKGKTGKRLAVGGGAILVLGVLFGMFGPFGFGSGSGEADGDGVVATTDPSASATVTSPEKRSTDGPADNITIVIDGHDFLQVVNVGGKAVQRAITLEDILKQVQTVPGDQDGIKIRVLRKDSARASAENALLTALNEGGVSNESVYMPDSRLE